MDAWPTGRRDASATESAAEKKATSTSTRILVTDSPADEDIALISDSLRSFNVGSTGIDDRSPLAVLVTDTSTGRVLGGLSGRTSLGLFFLDVFYLPPELRGAGIGSEILREAEAEARRRGCRAGVLYTISFQAPDFYRRHGWTVFGEVACDPDGTSRIFLSKQLHQDQEHDETGSRSSSAS